MIGDDLYKRGYGQPLLKFVTAEQAQYIIKELHEGICGYHSGARTMTPESFALGTSGQPWRPTATILSKDAYPARNMATSSTKNRNNFILYYPRGPSQSGEWTFSALSPREKAKYNS